MCISTATEGHTFVDAVVFSDYAETGGEYTAANGERRQWQRCTGCGNVQSREVELRGRIVKVSTDFGFAGQKDRTENAVFVAWSGDCAIVTMCENNVNGGNTRVYRDRIRF